VRRPAGALIVALALVAPLLTPSVARAETTHHRPTPGASRAPTASAAGEPTTASPAAASPAGSGAPAVLALPDDVVWDYDGSEILRSTDNGVEGGAAHLGAN